MIQHAKLAAVAIPAALGGLVWALTRVEAAKAQPPAAAPLTPSLPPPAPEEIAAATQTNVAANAAELAAIQEAKAAVEQLAKAQAAAAKVAPESPQAVQAQQVVQAAQQQATTAIQKEQAATAKRKQAHSHAQTLVQRAATPAPKSSKPVTQATRVRVAAELLKKWLLANYNQRAFGSSAFRSPPIAEFQKVAGIPADGIMGNVTRAAANNVGVVFPKRPRDGAATPSQAPASSAVVLTPADVPTLPPAPTAAARRAPEGYNPAEAKRLAQPTSDHLAAMKVARYSRDRVKAFQRAAGITADGFYGGGTRGALQFYGAQRVPNPFFKPVQTVTYVPPA